MPRPLDSDARTFVCCAPYEARIFRRLGIEVVHRASHGRLGRDQAPLWAVAALRLYVSVKRPRVSGKRYHEALRVLRAGVQGGWRAAFDLLAVIRAANACRVERVRCR